jgi:hypothetical protein
MPPKLQKTLQNFKNIPISSLPPLSPKLQKMVENFKKATISSTTAKAYFSLFFVKIEPFLR